MEKAILSRDSITTWGIRAILVVACLGALAFVLRPGARATEEITYRDQSAWMVSRASGEVVHINGVAGDVASRVSVGEPRSRLSLAPVGDDIAVLDLDAAAVRLVDGASLEAGEPSELAEAEGAELASNGSQAYLITRDAVQEITADPLGLGPSVELDGPVSSPVVAADGSLWAVHRGSGDIVTIRDGVADRRLSTDIDADALGVVAAGDRTLLVDLATPGLRTLDGTDTEPRGCAAALPAGRPVVGGSTTTSAQPYAGISNADEGEVVIWDVMAGSCRRVEVAEPGAELGPMVVDRTYGFVPDYDGGQVVIVDLVEGVERSRVTVAGDGQRFQLFERGGLVWFNNPFGSDSALLDENGVVRVIEKLGEGSGTDAIVDGIDANAAPTAGNTDGNGLGEEPGEGDAGTTGTNNEGGADTGGNTGLVTGPNVDPSASVPPTSAPTAPDEPEEPDPEAPLVANFTFSSSSVRVGESVEFVDRSSGAPSSWSWTFGDGTAGEGPIVSKAWSAEGTYTVTLTVDRDDGGSDATSIDILVFAEDAAVAPVADFAFTSSVVEVGQPVTFTDRSSGSPTSWDWSFGDGARSSGRSVTHSYSSPGRYTVGLTVANGEGTSFTDAEIVVAASIGVPNAAMVASDLDPLVGQTVTFRSTSTGSPTALVWDFGDGSTATGPVVGHAYTRAGTFTVRLTATNTAGSDSTTSTVVVSEGDVAPVARFTTSADEVVVDQAVLFTSTSLNDPTSLSWNFGDGQSATGPAVRHAFASPGSYDVTLTAVNAAGSDTSTQTITVAPGGVAPVASFSVSNENPTVGDAVTFTDRSSNNPTAWSWSFGDGSTSNAQSPPHSYNAPGTYTVTLTVTNDSGEDSLSRTITVAPRPPTAVFTASATSVQVGQPVTFTDQSAGDPTSWNWNFGDGSTSTERSPTHSYGMAGEMTVTLTVSNTAGSNQVSSTVNVLARPPEASFTITPAGGNTTASVIQFTDTSTNEPTSWSWDFGDDSTGTGPNPTHQYRNPGQYTVTLVVSNSGGTAQATRSIAIAQAVVAPQARFSVTPSTEVRVGGTLTFTDTSLNEPTSWVWTFPGGVTRNQPVTQFTFATPGQFIVSLTVANSAGQSSIQVPINVLPNPPTAAFSFTKAPDGVTVSFADASSGAPTGWIWSFGDGTSSTLQNPVKVYAAGTYTVTLRASNAGGQSAPASQTITITPVAPPTASFAVSTTQLTAVFTDTSSGAITAWAWSFGDGGTSAQRSPSHTYAAGGTYTVTLTVSGPGGSTSTSQAVTVTDPPPPTTTTTLPPPPATAAAPGVAPGNDP